MTTEREDYIDFVTPYFDQVMGVKKNFKKNRNESSTGGAYIYIVDLIQTFEIMPTLTSTQSRIM